MKNYDEASVIRSLSQKRSISIDSHAKVIQVQKENTEVGNKSWGKIDYLCKCHGYIYIFTNTPKAKTNINITNEQAINSKTAKREKKLNMAAMSKAAMKKARTK